ncbi:hypothetical protein [Streptomyces sp. BK205]|uniref:hypothetical protein n=1 Tax=Streptomyces sp. BK205 TaxID=2512164 RepID=UPI0010E123ED|nr:hypothetical protein [Streptomyces sp. BK205]TCR22935.1 hypothetical protein EV578_104265 [Streptomyces sp. BK205]
MPPGTPPSCPRAPELSAVAPTVEASDTHGPAHRVVRIYSTDWLSPTVVRAEVVRMTGWSDHDTPVVTYDLGLVIEIQGTLFGLAA